MNTKITRAEADAAAETITEAQDALNRALRRVSEDTGVNLLATVNRVNDACAAAKLSIEARTEKETGN